MKSLLLRIIALSLSLVAVGMLSNQACAQSEPPNTAAQSASSNMFTLDGADNALFSPSGRFLAIQSPLRFKVLIIDSLFNHDKQPSGFKDFPGRVIGFLPPEKCIIGAPKGTFELDLASLTVRSILDSDLTKPYGDYSMVDRQIIPVGDSSLIYGLGRCSSEPMGLIFRMFLDATIDTIVAPIGQFSNALVSDDGKYVLFQSGCDNRKTATLLSVQSGKCVSLSDYFANSVSNFDIGSFSQLPLGWVALSDICIVQLTGTSGADTTRYLAAFDILHQRVAWKTTIERPLTEFTLINDKIALAAHRRSAVHINLETGKTRPATFVPSAPFGINPDRSLVAYIADSSVYVIPADGGQSRKVATIRDLRLSRTPDGYGYRSLLWSSQNNALVVFDERHAILIKVD